MIFLRVYGQGPLVIERDSANAIKWAKGLERLPWKLITLAREIRGLTLGMDVSFVQVSRTSNEVADFFAKYGVNNSDSGVFLL